VSAVTEGQDGFTLPVLACSRESVDLSEICSLVNHWRMSWCIAD